MNTEDNHEKWLQENVKRDLTDAEKEELSLLTAHNICNIWDQNSALCARFICMKDGIAKYSVCLDWQEADGRLSVADFLFAISTDTEPGEYESSRYLEVTQYKSFAFDDNEADLAYPVREFVSHSSDMCVDDEAYTRQAKIRADKLMWNPTKGD